MLLSQIADKLGVSYEGTEAEITAINSLESAVVGEIAFLSDMSYISRLSTTSASAVLVPAELGVVDECRAVLLPVKNVESSLNVLLSLFAPLLAPPRVNRHPSAVIDPEAILADDVIVGPGAVIERNAVIGRATTISAGCYIGQNVRVGDNCMLWPNVVINYNCILGNNVEIHGNTTIGTMGFGYRMEKGRHIRIEHVGNVLIEDNVEIGANTCIDRAKVGSTRVGSGTKIDNLVQIAHNVQIGQNCIIVGQAGIAGSSKLGNYVVLAGQVGIADHCEIGDKAQLGVRTGVFRGQHIPAGAVVLGTPAQDKGEELRQMAVIRKLPEIARDVKKLLKAEK